MAIQVNIDSLDKTKSIARNSLTIENILTRQVDRCRFTLRKYGTEHTYEPTVGKEVTVYNGITKIFGGIIVKVTQRAEDYKVILFDVECEDYTRLLDRKLIPDSFQNQTIDDIISSINTNYLTGFTLSNVDCPVTLNSVSFNYLPASVVFQQLADLVNYDWYVDYDKDIHFFSKTTTTAPFDLNDDDGSYIFKSLRIRRDNSQVRNVIHIRGGEYLGATFTTEIEADGTQNILNLPYKYKDLTATLTGQALSVGLDYINDPDSYDVLWNFQEKILRFKDVDKPSVNAVTRVGGRPYLPVRVKIRDKDSIDAMITAEGGSGEYEFLVIDNSIDTREGARERGKAELESYKTTLSEAEFETYTDGLKAGQRLRINSTAHGIDEYFIINKVTTRMWTDSQPRYKVSLVTTKTFGIIEYLQRLLTDETRKFSINPDEVIDLVETVDETISIEETDVTFSLSHNLQNETITMSETFTAQSLNYETEFVLGPFLPVDVGIETDTNLIGRWELDDNVASTTVVENISGNNATCSVNTNTLAEECGAYPGGLALNFDGSSRVTYSDAGGNYDLGNNDDYSIACWVRFSTNGDESISEHWEGGGSYPWAFRKSVDGWLTFSIYDGSNNPVVGNTGAQNDGEWHHIVGVRDNTNGQIRFYLDGNMTQESSDTTTGDVSSVSNGFAIGSRSIAGSNLFNGQIKDFRVYDKVLTQADVTEIYHTKKRVFILNGSVLG